MGITNPNIHGSRIANPTEQVPSYNKAKNNNSTTGATERCKRLYI